MRNLPRLKREMKRLGVTQHAVAARCDVDRTMVNKVVNGKAKAAHVLAAIEGMLAEARALKRAS